MSKYDRNSVLCDYITHCTSLTERDVYRVPRRPTLDGCHIYFCLSTNIYRYGPIWKYASLNLWSLTFMSQCNNVTVQPPTKHKRAETFSQNSETIQRGPSNELLCRSSTAVQLPSQVRYYVHYTMSRTQTISTLLNVHLLQPPASSLIAT